MAAQKRCFSTTKALRRLHPGLLADVLRKFPDYLKASGIRLPKAPDEDSMPYEAIQQACMAGDIPLELDDVLYFTCLLGTAPGWEKIQAEAEFQRMNLDFPVAGLSAADLAMKAWLHDWPCNRQLLEKSYARAKIHARSAYVYYAPYSDVRAQYQTPTPAKLDELRESLAKHFVSKGLGRGTDVLQYDFEKEIWFLVRHPGQTRRYAAISDDGLPTSHAFKPEQYDAVVYHKEFGDLRVNARNKQEHSRYRIEFADLLLGKGGIFQTSCNIILLEPLRGDCAKLFHCNDIPGLAEIVPVELCFTSLLYPGMMIYLKANDNTHLLLYDTSRGNILRGHEADSFQYARFRYRLTNSRQYYMLTVRSGNSLKYDRDGDSSVLEDWLRARRFVTSPLEEPSRATKRARTT